MNRRAVIGGVAAGLSIGGVYRVTRIRPALTVAAVSNIGVQSSSLDERPEVGPADPPQVRVADDGAAMRISGTLYVPSSNHEIVVDSVEYDSDVDGLTVRVDSRRPLRTYLAWQSDRLDSYFPLSYVVHVEFADQPAILKAVEIGRYLDEERSTSLET